MSIIDYSSSSRSSSSSAGRSLGGPDGACCYVTRIRQAVESRTFTPSVSCDWRSNLYKPVQKFIKEHAWHSISAGCLITFFFQNKLYFLLSKLPNKWQLNQKYAHACHWVGIYQSISNIGQYYWRCQRHQYT